MNTITMSHQELSKFEVITKLIEKEITTSCASKKLNLSERQIKRLRKKVKKDGAKGLINLSRGKPSNRKTPDDIRENIEKFLKDKYPDFGPTFATEKLLENHQLVISKETVRLYMVGLGLRKIRGRKTNKEYRAWRPRKESYGEMQQFDGSYHHWFEDRGGEHCLLASIDDATGKITQATFSKNEGVTEVSKFWSEYVQRYGKPTSIYLDRYSTYKVNHASAVDNSELLTQFQAMTKRIGMILITAHSPEAKGRIERLYKTLQDRLVKDMRLLNLSTPEEGNKYLQEVFIPKFNATFSVLAEKAGDAHLKLSPTELENLPSIFSIQKTRVVSNDFCVRFENMWIQLEKIQPTLVCRKDVIVLERRLDDTLQVSLRGKYLNWKLLPERPAKLKEKITALSTAPLIRRTIPTKPAGNHPWRKSNFLFKRKFAIKGK